MKEGYRNTYPALPSPDTSWISVNKHNSGLRDVNVPGFIAHLCEHGFVQCGVWPKDKEWSDSRVTILWHPQHWVLGNVKEYSSRGKNEWRYNTSHFSFQVRYRDWDIFGPHSFGSNGPVDGQENQRAMLFDWRQDLQSEMRTFPELQAKLAKGGAEFVKPTTSFILSIALGTLGIKPQEAEWAETRRRFSALPADAREVLGFMCK